MTELLERPVMAKPTVTGWLTQGNIRRVPWDKNDPASVERARQVFLTGLMAGMAAFEGTTTTGPWGLQVEMQSTREFNPEAEVIEMTAQYAGG